MVMPIPLVLKMQHNTPSQDMIHVLFSPFNDSNE